MLDGGPGVVRVCLRPDREVAMARNRTRAASGAEREYLDRGIRVIDEQLAADGPAMTAAGWVMRANGRLSTLEAAARILGLG